MLELGELQIISIVKIPQLWISPRIWWRSGSAMAFQATSHKRRSGGNEVRDGFKFHSTATFELKIKGSAASLEELLIPSTQLQESLPQFEILKIGLQIRSINQHHVTTPPLNRIEMVKMISTRIEIAASPATVRQKVRFLLILTSNTFLLLLKATTLYNPINLPNYSQCLQ
jgi:hypothetical protein